MTETEDFYDNFAWGTKSRGGREVFLPDLSYPASDDEERAAALNVLDALDGHGDDDLGLYQEWNLIMNALGLAVNLMWPE